METAREFTLRLQDLLRRERFALADFLVALAEFDRRRVWVEAGYASLFDFLHRELRLSKGAAFYRKAAVELMSRFPEVVEPLRDGRLCLMTVAEVARVLTQENRRAVLPRFFGLSKREAQTLVAELRPAEDPPMRAVVTPIRGPAAVTLALTSLVAPPRVDPAQSPVQPVEPEDRELAERAPRAAVPPASAATVQPLTAELSRYHLTVSRRFLEKLAAAQAALSHSHPGAGPEEILEAGMDLLLARDAKRKGLVKKPLKAPRSSSDPEYVPAHVRRAVWERDGGKCQVRLASGEILRLDRPGRPNRRPRGSPAHALIRVLRSVHGAPRGGARFVAHREDRPGLEGDGRVGRAPRRRSRRARSVSRAARGDLPLFFVVLAFGIVGVAAEWSIRCPKCRRSLGWWAYSTGSPTKARAMLVNATECPYCGYAGTEARESR